MNTPLGIKIAHQGKILYLAFDGRLLPAERGVLHTLTPAAVLALLVRANDPRSAPMSTECPRSRDTSRSLGEIVDDAIRTLTLALDGPQRGHPPSVQLDHLLDVQAQLHALAGDALGKWAVATQQVAAHFQVEEIRVIGVLPGQGWEVTALSTPTFRAAYQAKA